MRSPLEKMQRKRANYKNGNAGRGALIGYEEIIETSNRFGIEVEKGRDQAGYRARL